jgi:phage antirepressor YoqD-like protein
MAAHIDAGRFVVKAGTSQGSGHAFNQPKFTPKGVTWIAGEWAKHCLHSREHA